MKAFLDAWERRAAVSPVIRFVDVNLRGIGQVMFQDNPLTGLLFLLAILWGALAAGAPSVAAGAVVAVLVSTLTALWLKVDEAPLRAGLYGYNAVLVGLALPTFLAAGWLLWLYVVLGAAVSVVAMLATAKAVERLGVSALTFPFVLVSWLLLLASYGFAAVSGPGLPAGGVVGAAAAVASDPLHFADFVGGVLLSVSQVFLKASLVSALLFLVGLAIGSPAAAIFAVAGAIVAVLVAHLFGAESTLVTGGLLGFSPVLTAVALGTVFYKPSPRVIAYAALGTIFTVIVQAAMNAALQPFAIPTLTAPFVLATWMFLLPQQALDPPPGST